MHGRVIEDRAGALQTLLGHARPGAVRRLPPAEAIGLVLADEVCAACAVPEVASSMRDGYALRASDIASATTRSPVTLPLGGCLPAETELPEPLGDGRTIRVLTGAPLPPGADCVVADERVSLISDGVVFVAHTSPGRHVRPAGMDLPLGTRIVGAGERVTPQLAAILVRARLVQVPVFPSPTAAAFSIGNELADPYVPSADGRMPADNLVMTTGLLGQAGLETLRRAVLPDRVQDVVAALTREPYPDLIVTTGGTGRSERDVARTGAELAGFTPLFGSVD
ncbi:MAG: molybdopterin molybdenumtransferase MoeA, partial [Proteobacteria bacterium]|nr:molybdopterin molybdenumtransferase MoeA [Pseudomonadota bacterium]